jgi:hypothetical protein
MDKNKLEQTCIQINQVLFQTSQASRMSFMDKNKLNVSMRSSGRVNSKLTWQVEAHCMRLDESKHASNDQPQFKVKQVK